VTSRDPPGGGQPRGLLDRIRAGGCEIEIGCGNGHFLAAYADGKPDTFFIGIDIKAKRCQKAREKAEKRGLANVAVFQGPAETFLRDLPPRSIDAFHIYFPDPWPKSRHRKRRFFTMETLRVMYERLQDGGRLYFGTDFFDYFIQAKVLVALQGGFRITDEPAPEAVLSSLYGQRFVGERKNIHVFSAIRRSTDEQGEEHEDQRHVHDDVQREKQD
jgi:tRNA (guanine-N(7)-)-methyltransferase